MSIERWAPLAGGAFEQAPDGYLVMFEDHERELARHKGAIEDWACKWERADENNQALLARLDAAQLAHDKLVDVLRAVQLDHSRALDIGEDLERRIDELIGPHPRDGQ